jgi:AP-1 complex subunit beta-1
MCQCFTGIDWYSRELCCARSCRCNEGQLLTFSTQSYFTYSTYCPSIQDIFRKYPSTYEGVIPILCSNLDELDEPEAKASLIWIIGEYANTIDNADELLGIFVDTFTEESYPVRVASFISL